MRQNRWQLHRAGVFNFWYYDDEQFHFADGKLLLRGSNGSGKSVTMQSFIPVLLDGRKSPDRLDPFGSKARRMEDYLLGEKDIVERDERTGYLYLEYKRVDAEQYVTTGIGLRAKRGSHLDFWGFVITDNRRIGYDFFLYKTEYSAEDGKELKIPLTRRELESRLDRGGRVVQSSKEYMELVNKHVFGFESLEAYEELIKLLIQLRSPKLSKDFKPTVIYDILNASLPPLSDEELRPLSDTIETMDQIKQQLDQLERDQAALERLIKHYDQYNRYVLTEKADRFLKAVQKQEQLEKELETCMKTQQAVRAEQEELGQQLTRLKQEEAVLHKEEEELKQHDVFRAQQEKREAEEQLRRIQDQRVRKEQTLEAKRTAENDVRQTIQRLEDKRRLAEKSVYEHLDELEYSAEEARFSGHALARQEFEQHVGQPFDFTLWKKEASDYTAQLSTALQLFSRLQEAKERLDEAERELGERKKALDIKRHEELQWREQFEAEKDAFLQAFHQWHQHNDVLTLEADQVQLAAQRMMHWYDPYRLKEIKQPVDEAFQGHYRYWQDEKIALDNKLKAKAEEIEQKEAEIEHWKALKDPEPERHPETEAFRRRLTEQAIPHVPFYSVVEFHDHVTPEMRANIESAIAQMGLLDALIVPPAYLNKDVTSDQVDVISDRVIRPEPDVLAHTLADLMYPTPNPDIAVSAANIEDVLRSIRIDDQQGTGAFVNEKGQYTIGVLEGHAPPEEASIYIGKEQRRQFRLRTLARLQEELDALNEEHQALRNCQEEVERKLNKLQEEYDQFPDEAQVDAAYEEWQDLRRDVEALNREVKQKNEQVKQHLTRWQSIKHELQAHTAAIDVPSDEQAYQRAHAEMERYGRLLQELQLGYKDMANLTEQLDVHQSHLAGLEADVDELKGEINVLDDEWNKWNLALEQIASRLKAMGAEEIQAKIEHVQARLKDIPQEKERLIKEQTRLGEELKQEQNKHEQLSAEQQFITALSQAWEEVFVKDVELKFVPVERVDDDAAPLELAKQMKKQYGFLLSERDKDRTQITSDLNKAYFQEQAGLIEYRMTQETIHELADGPDPGDNEWFGQQVEQLKQTSRRIQLLMEYNGARVSPYYVKAQIEKEIDLQKSILTQKDRELYEEIIMNSVGRIIRARINRAEQWVKQIDRLMSERNSSSGLTFSLRWKPRTADNEEEMDTKELVDLLRADPRLLKEEDIERVTRHFRSKIERAKTWLEDKGYGDTLHQAIKEILDYRQWFAFTLYYKREGESKRELTNHVFYTFSGGEKAMAMYIPLFSAAYSRYLEARQDAPYIISLDEAFAGVDENNIRDMFDLMEKLGFDYIINSQALWGDYDTVPALSICELVRPKNAPFVTVVRYRWDGHVRQLVDAEEEMVIESG